MDATAGRLQGTLEDDVTQRVSHARTEDNGQKSNILMVDDNDANLLALEATLKDLGQNLVKAGSGPEALRHLLQRDFAVILLDVRMPDMDGFETAELIRGRRRSRHTPIILITAAGVSPEQIARGYAVGAVDYIFKPFMPEVLKAKVTIFLELYWKSEEIKENEARLRHLIANVPGAVYRREAAHPWNMLFLSESVGELTGHPASDFLDRRREFASIIHPEDAPSTLDALAEVARKNAPYALEYRVVHHDGRVRWIVDRGLCVPHNSGTPSHMDGVLFEVTEQKVAEEAIRELLGRLIEIQDDERRQIARELHENTSPLLNGLFDKLYNLKHRTNEIDPMTWKFLDDSLKLTEEAGSVIRNVSYLLHPRSLDDKGLLSALRWYVTGFITRTGIAVGMNFPEELPRMQHGVEIALFRVVQESLTNVLRYAPAAVTRIRLFIDRGNVTLEVGNQAAPTAAAARISARSTRAGHAAPGGIGLAAVRERIRQLGGTLDISSSVSGTSVRATVPLPPVKN